MLFCLRPCECIEIYFPIWFYNKSHTSRPIWTTALSFFPSPSFSLNTTILCVFVFLVSHGMYIARSPAYRDGASCLDWFVISAMPQRQPHFIFCSAGHMRCRIIVISFKRVYVHN